jgi:hypothetical protein
MDTTQFGGTVWITIAGMSLGFLATVGVYCLKAKCNQVTLCWGLIKIKRDVNAEIRENAHELDHGINPYQFQPPTFTSTTNGNSNNNSSNSNSTAIPTHLSNSILVPAPTTPPLPAPINNV